MPSPAGRRRPGGAKEVANSRRPEGRKQRRRAASCPVARMPSCPAPSPAAFRPSSTCLEATRSGPRPCPQATYGTCPSAGPRRTRSSKPSSPKPHSAPPRGSLRNEVLRPEVPPQCFRAHVYRLQLIGDEAEGRRHAVAGDGRPDCLKAELPGLQPFRHA